MAHAAVARQAELAQRPLGAAADCDRRPWRQPLDQLAQHLGARSQLAHRGRAVRERRSGAVRMRRDDVPEHRVGGDADREPKYGLAVTGAVDPKRLVRNSTARAGRRLYLTKPVGGGVASTAAKRGVASKALVRNAIDVMTTLNRDASVLALASDVSAMTDVTGFGLLGHLHEMALGSGLAAEVDAAAVPAIPASCAAARGRAADRGRQPAQPRVGRAVGRLGRRRARGAALAPL